MAIGPALGGLAATHDYAILFVGDGATNLLAAIVVFWLARRTMARQLAKSSGTDDARARSRAERDGPFLLLLASVFLLCVVFFQVFFVMPLVFRDLYGFDESIIGPMLALNAVLIAILEMPIVRAVEHRNQALVFTVGAVLVAVGVAATGLGSSIGFAALTVCVWTLGEMLSLPMANALVAQRGEKAGAVGAYMGMFTAAFALSSVVGPPLGLLAYSELGAGALFASVLAVGVTLVAMGWPLSRLIQPATNENAGAAR
jgi:predicted MFS family arabinose efflux permease